MLKDAIKLVIEFQKKARQTVRDNPTLLLPEEIARRIHWINEELLELQNAQTIEEQVDAVTDALYYLLGCYIEMGVLDPDNIFATVHESNMKKLDVSDVCYDLDGRVLKPQGWEHPTIRID